MDNNKVGKEETIIWVSKDSLLNLIAEYLEIHTNEVDESFVDEWIANKKIT